MTMPDPQNTPRPDENPRGISRLWRRGRHVNRLGLVAGLAGAAALAIGTTASLGGFTASITNPGDQVASGDLLMQEQVTPTGGTTSTCLSTAGGAAITTNANTNCGSNKFGNLTNAAPGGMSFSTVVLTNQGSLPANSLSMGVGACTATPTQPAAATATNVGSDTAGFCGKVDVTIEDDTGSAACVYPAGAGACPALSNTYNLSTLTTFAPTGTPKALTAPVAPGGARTYKVTVGLDNSATNADQAMAAVEPITFTFGS
jgi:hypothetical protein